MALWTEHLRNPDADERRLIELARTIGPRLAGGPGRMVPLLLLYAERSDTPTDSIALWSPDEPTSEQAARIVLERKPSAWLLVREANDRGRDGFLVDVGGPQAVFVVFFTGDEAPVVVEQRVSPLRRTPTDEEATAALDAARRLAALDADVVLALDDASNEELILRPDLTTRSTGHLMDQASELMFGRTADFRLAGATRDGTYVGVTRGDVDTMFLVKGDTLTLLKTRRVDGG